MVDVAGDFAPNNALVKGLLTDMYQLTMAYAYWNCNRHEEPAVFEAFFRKNPFKGEFTIFAGLEEVLRYVSSLRFSENDISYLKTAFPATTKPEFFEWLGQIDASQVKIYALKEGSVAFPRVPVIRVEGPLGVAQIMETAILNLTNFASLVATNAQRMRLAAGLDKTLLEFGLRRAQGPDGAISASRYSYLGGFDGTSNCLAGSIFGIAIKGTQAHAFVTSFQGPENLNTTKLDGKEFWSVVTGYRKKLGFNASKECELAAFTSYAQSFPTAFLALVDTYDTIVSGIPNYICVALALKEFGYKPLGVRLDSGDLSYLSLKARELLNLQGLEDSIIVASNDINEQVLHSLEKEGHAIDSFGIGTNLVTCQAQPALGMVYKLVECNGVACIKLSNEFEKVTIPGRKHVYRLFGETGLALCDLIVRQDEPPPEPGMRVLCQHPVNDYTRCFVRPSRVENLHQLFFENGKLVEPIPNLQDSRNYRASQIELVRADIKRSLNPAEYKVSLSKSLHEFVKQMWSKQAPIAEVF